MIEQQGTLVTCDAESDHLALEELLRCGINGLPGEWLDTGDAVQGSILLLPTVFQEVVTSLESVFVRHLAPVQFQVPLAGSPDDVQTVAELVPRLADTLEPGKSFSVQTRLLGEGKLPFRKVVLNETLSMALESVTGLSMDCRHPQQVVSVLCSPSTAYVGVSPVEQNRSDWPGGKHRFKREERQVSRAEFKLLEAFDVFGLDLPSGGKTLDIGASPGGWSRVLASRGFLVDAVDPGDLDPRLKGIRQIRHFRKRIQEYRTGTQSFAVIVNDMKMDARESIDIMLGFADRLDAQGVAVMTLKMPKPSRSQGEARRTLNMLDDDLARLATGFRIIGARQLYHNRSEVTVVLASRNDRG